MPGTRSPRRFRESCELAGATLVEIIPLASDEEMYQLGDREKCRCRLDP